MARADTSPDVIILGAGHNGLTCAAYLARAGVRVTVLEARAILGGAAVTEEFYPGFRNSTASYTVSLLNPRVIKDLDLRARGLHIVERPATNYFPFPDGSDFLMPNDSTAKDDAVKTLAPEDFQGWQRYGRDISLAADLLRDQVLKTPPSPKGGLSDILAILTLGRRFRALASHDQHMVLDLFTRSAEEFLRGYFTNEKLIAALVFDGIIGHYAPPDAPGSAYVLLHHAFGEVNGKPGVWGHALGGMGAISDALAQAARAHGAYIRTNAPVQKVLVKNGKVTGVLLQGGQVLKARRVAAAIGPKLLFDTLIDKAAVPPAVSNRMSRWITGSGVFRMNVALKGLPNFTARPTGETNPHLGAGIIIGPSAAYLREAYEDARRDGWSKRPFIEMLIPSVIDQSLAPKGQHVASLFCQYVAPNLPHGLRWQDIKETVARHMIATVDDYAPGFQDLVLGYEALSPADLESRFGLVDGDIFHGRLSLDQLFSARPMLGHADYRMPIKGLYLCGSGAHPGGGVTGIPGMKAAETILKDL